MCWKNEHRHRPVNAYWFGVSGNATCLTCITSSISAPLKSPRLATLSFSMFRQTLNLISYSTLHSSEQLSPSLPPSQLHPKPLYTSHAPVEPIHATLVLEMKPHQSHPKSKPTATQTPTATRTKPTHRHFPRTASWSRSSARSARRGTGLESRPPARTPSTPGP